MKLSENINVLITIALIGFIVVITVVLWLVDLLAQQRSFGLLLSAELVAFATLVHIYVRNLREK